MTKAIKITGITLIALFLLFLAAVIIMVNLANPNDYKTKISEALYQQTGRQLRIGHIDWRFFPRLGLKVQDVELSNNPKFGTRPFADLDEADVNLKLMPLFTGRIEMGKVLIKGLQLNLTKNKQGVGNWQDLTGIKTSTLTHKKHTTSNKTAAQIPPAQQPTTVNNLAGLMLPGLDVENVSLNWQDQSTNQSFQLKGLNIKSERVASNLPFAFEMTFNFTSDDKQYSGPVSLATTLTADFADQVVKINQLQLSSKLSGKAFQGKTVAVTLEANARANLKQQTAQVKSFSFTINKAKIEGNLNAAQIFTNPRFDGKITSNDIDPKALLTELGQPIPATQDPSVLKKLSISTTISGTKNSLNTNHLHLVLDTSTLSGSIAITDIKQPSGQFSLALDHLDLDRYLPPPAATSLSLDEAGLSLTPISEAAAAPPIATKPASAPALPMALLRKLNLAGQIKITQLKVHNILMHTVSLTVNAGQGLLSIDPISMKLFDGTFDGHTRLNVQGEVPSFTVSKSILHVDTKQLLHALYGFDNLSGTLNANINLKGKGFDADTIKRTISGKASVNIANGAISKMDLDAILQQALAMVQNKPAIKKASDQQTSKFADLDVQSVVQNGIVNTQSIQLNSRIASIKNGHGTLNLLNDKMDYTLQIIPEGKDYAKQLGKMPIPVTYSGNFPEAFYNPKLDLSALANNLVNQHKDELQEQLQNKAQKMMKEHLGDFLNSI